MKNYFHKKRILTAKFLEWVMGEQVKGERSQRELVVT